MKFLCVLGLVFSLYALADELEASQDDTGSQVSNMQPMQICMAQLNYVNCRNVCIAYAQGYTNLQKLTIFFKECMKPCRRICSFPGDQSLALVLSPERLTILQKQRTW